MTLQVCSAQKWSIIAILFGFGVLKVVMEFRIWSIQWNRQLDQLRWPHLFVLFMAVGGVVRAGKRGWKESLRRCSLMILLLEILWERPSSKIIEGQQQNILFKYIPLILIKHLMNDFLSKLVDGLKLCQHFETQVQLLKPTPRPNCNDFSAAPKHHRARALPSGKPLSKIYF